MLLELTSIVGVDVGVFLTLVLPFTLLAIRYPIPVPTSKIAKAPACVFAIH